MCRHLQTLAIYHYAALHDQSCVKGREGERERVCVCVGKRETDRPHAVWDLSCLVVPLSTVSLPACYRTCQHIVFTCKYLHANYLSLPIAVQPNADTCCSRQAQACSRRQTPHKPKNNIAAHAQGKHATRTRQAHSLTHASCNRIVRIFHPCRTHQGETKDASLSRLLLSACDTKPLNHET